MKELIELLTDGKSRTMEMLAEELGKSTDLIKRDVEFLEKAGVIKRVVFTDTCSPGHSCDGCTGCGTGGAGGKACASCMPEGGFKNMGVMWEIV